MDKQQRLALAILGGVLAVLLILLTVLALSREPNVIVSDFEAPPFEENVLADVPDEVLDRADFRSLDVKGNYVFSILGSPDFRNGDLLPYLASHEENKVFLLIKVYDADGTQLGKSGLIRPGECLPSVALTRAPMGNTVSLKVFSYEPDTYFSRGSATLNLALSPN